MESYNAISLDDYHAYQKGGVSTKCNILFLAAKNMQEAKRYLKKWYPKEAYAVISDKDFNKNIVYADV